MPTTADLARALDAVAPSRLAEEWDNVGLLVGDPDEELAGGPVLLAIDLTADVAAEAIDRACSAVIAYHPPLFKPTKRLTAATPRERAVLRVIRAGMPILSPHTALDAVPEGVAEWLARTALADGERGRDLRALAAHTPTGDEVKLVVFVPEAHADALRTALSDAGAGVIGAYSQCSFASPGTGTFLGDDTTNPAIGSRGALERVDELRMEMVCPQRALASAIATLWRAHPYEEPAFDVYPLTPKPDTSAGAGRAITLDTPTDARTLAQRVARALGVEGVKIATPNDERPIERVGVCPGAGASLVRAAIDDGCDAFLTGEMSHHEALAAIDAGLTLLLAGHTNTERPYLPILATRLHDALPACAFEVSARDRAPFSWRAT